MRLGNITETMWKRSVFSQMHTQREEVLFPLSAEECCSALTVPEGNVSLHTQAWVIGNAPYTGAYAATRGFNDLAAHGAKPTALSVQVLLPPSCEEETLRAMMGPLEEVCALAGVQPACVRAAAGPFVSEPVVFITAHGDAKKEEITGPGGAVPGQDIVLCGYVGLEGMLRILDERYTELSKRFVPAFLNQAQSLRGRLLVLKAISAAKKAGAAAMHQIGSGGILGGLWELAQASCIGLEAELGKMSIRQETIEICEYYRLNPYQMTSQGAILMTAGDGDKLVKALEEAGAQAVKLGITTDKNARIIKGGQEDRHLEKPGEDELIRWWAENKTVTGANAAAGTVLPARE